MPAVTNFRVSFDFCYGNSWAIGVSSLLVWALGAAPSKDTLWSTPNNFTSIPGCPWTRDHEAAALELHVVLAVMSTGPVGISDAIGLSNATLLQRTIAKDGTLLQPSKPITAIDSTFRATGAPRGEVYSTFSAVRAQKCDAWYFASFQMKSEHALRVDDFYPPLDPRKRVIAYRRFDSGAGCVDGEDAVASGCVSLVPIANFTGAAPVLRVPASDYANATAGTDLAPTLTTVWQPCGGVDSGGYILLGELSKYGDRTPEIT
jgi:hypothetical protein